MGIHRYKLNAIEFEIQREVKPGTNGLDYWYLGELNADCSSLNNDECTLTIEFFTEWKINPEVIVQSDSLTIEKQDDKYLVINKNILLTFRSTVSVVHFISQ